MLTDSVAYRAPVLAVPDVGLWDQEGIISAETRLRSSWVGVLSGVPLAASVGVLVELEAPAVLRIFIEVVGPNESDAVSCTRLVERLLTPLVSLGEWTVSEPTQFRTEILPFRPSRRPTVPAPGIWPERAIGWARILENLASSPGVFAISVSCTAADISPAVAGAASRRLARLERRAGVENVLGSEEGSVIPWRGRGESSVVARVTAQGDASKMTQFINLLQDACGVEERGIAVHRVPAQGFGSLNQLIDAAVSGRVVSAERASALLPLPIADSSVSLSIGRRHLSSGQYAVDPAGAALIVGLSDHGTAYSIPVDDLAQHLLVTGLQGYGKSTTVKTLLTQLWDDFGIPFLVVDPLKDDYFSLSLARPLADGSHSPRVLEVGGDGGRFNPLAVPDDVDPASFAGVLADCYDGVQGLSLTFPLGMSVMRKALSSVYEDWDQTLEGDGWPTLAHLYAQVQREISSTGRGETAQALRASLPTRLEALVSGTSGDALTGGPRSGLPWGQITAEPTVVSLRRLADATSREACFSFVLAGLMAYRRAHGLSANGHVVQHVAVLEEAHMVLKSGENARAVAEALATQRSMGQAYVLATQSPSQLPGLVYELFPSRISHRLTGGEGSNQVASAMGLPSPAPLQALARGEVLALNANGYSSPVRVRVATPGEGVALPSFWAAAHVEPPERYWCERCPAPCLGRQWMAQLPTVLAPLLGETGFMEATVSEQADRLARLLIQARHQHAPESLGAIEGIRAGLYCGVARGLTMIHAGDARQCRRAQDVARQVADGTTNALTRARNGRGG